MRDFDKRREQFDHEFEKTETFMKKWMIFVGIVSVFVIVSLIVLAVYAINAFS